MNEALTLSELESALELAVKKECLGLCIKFKSEELQNMPDYMLLLPRGHTAWVVIKTDGSDLSFEQQMQQKQLFRREHYVYVVRNQRDIDYLVSHLRVHMYCVKMGNPTPSYKRTLSEAIDVIRDYESRLIKDYFDMKGDFDFRCALEELRYDALYRHRFEKE